MKKKQYTGEHLSNSRCNSCSRNPHLERKNKKPIKKNIGYRPHQHCPHGECRVSVIPYGCSQKHRQTKENIKHCIKTDINRRFLQKHWTCPKSLCKMTGKKNSQQAKQNGITYRIKVFLFFLIMSNFPLLFSVSFHIIVS